MKKRHGDPETLVNTRNRYGHTPLYVASRNGHLEMAKIIARRGAIIDALSSAGKKKKETVIDVASRWNH